MDWPALTAAETDDNELQEGSMNETFEPWWESQLCYKPYVQRRVGGKIIREDMHLHAYGGTELARNRTALAHAWLIEGSQLPGICYVSKLEE